MPKNFKKDKSSYAEKKAGFWRSIITQKVFDIRSSLSNTAIEAQTQSDEGLTGIMLAAVNNKPKVGVIFFGFFVQSNFYLSRWIAY